MSDYIAVDFYETIDNAYKCADRLKEDLTYLCERLEKLVDVVRPGVLYDVLAEKDATFKEFAERIEEVEKQADKLNRSFEYGDAIALTNIDEESTELAVKLIEDFTEKVLEEEEKLEQQEEQTQKKGRGR